MTSKKVSRVVRYAYGSSIKAIAIEDGVLSGRVRQSIRSVLIVASHRARHAGVPLPIGWTGSYPAVATQEFACWALDVLDREGAWGKVTGEAYRTAHNAALAKRLDPA